MTPKTDAKEVGRSTHVTYGFCEDLNKCTKQDMRARTRLFATTHPKHFNIRVDMYAKAPGGRRASERGVYRRQSHQAELLEFECTWAYN